MSRLIKWTLFSIAALVALLVVAVTAVVMVVDPNDYRDEIETLLEEQTGRDLSIEGALRLTLFPWLGVEVGRMTLADAPGFYDEPFFEVDRVQAAVRLLPLLRGQLETRVVEVERPTLRLMLDAEGRGNWESLLEQLAAGDDVDGEAQPATTTDGSEAAADTADTVDEADAATPPPALLTQAVIGGLRFSQGRIVWTDRRSGEAEEVEVDPLQIELGALRLGEPVDLDGQWRLRGTQLPQLDGQLELTAALDSALERLSIDALRFELLASGSEVPGGMQRLRSSGHGRIELGEALRIDWPALQIDGAGATLNAALDLRLGEEGPLGALDWTLDPLNLKTTLHLLDIELGPTHDPEALSSFGGSGSIAIDGERIELNALKLTLDESQLEGRAAVTEWGGPTLSFQLQLDEIDLDRYLAAETPDATPSVDPAIDEDAPAGLPDLEAVALDFPLEPLRTLNLDGQIEIGRLTVGGVVLEALAAELSGEDGRVGVDPMSARLYAGTYHGRTLLDARGDYPYLRLEHRLDGVEIGPLLAALAERDWLHGTAALRFAGEGGGETLYALIEAFRGDLEIDVEDGALLGLNLPHLFTERVAELRGEPQPEPPDDAARTDFASLTAHFEMRDGVFHNDDLHAASPVLTARGRGRVELLKERIDYRLALTPVEGVSGSDGEQIAWLRDVTVPLLLTGDLFAPSVRFDLRAALGEERLRRLQEGEEAAREAYEAEREAQRQRLDETRKALEEERRQLKEARQAEEERARRRAREEVEQRLQQLR